MCCIVIIMLAGAGALSNEQYGGGTLPGSSVMALLIFFTLIFGTKGLINSFYIVVPFIVVSAIGIGLITIIATPSLDYTLSEFKTSTPMLGNWFTSALLFVSYNTFGIIAVFIPLGSEARSKRDIKLGALLGGGILGVCILIISYAIIINYPLVSSTEVPMPFLAYKISPFLGEIYTIILFAGIYTTAVGFMFALIEKAKNIKKINNQLKLAIMLSLALLCSKLGFAALIAVVYPLTGYVGFVALLAILANYFKRRISLKNLHF